MPVAKLRWVILAVISLAIVLVVPPGLAQGASPSGRPVIQVPIPTFSIQSAINSASPGATIHVGPGIYVEQLSINKSVTLVGAGVGLTILQSPKVLQPDYLGSPHLVEIGDRAQVAISGFTLEISLQCIVAPFADGGGIGVGGNGALTLTRSLVTTFGPTANVGASCMIAGHTGAEILGDGVDVGFNSPPLGVGVSPWKLHGHAILRHDTWFGFAGVSNGAAISVGDSSLSGSSALIESDLVVSAPASLPFLLHFSFHPEVLITNGATASVRHSTILGGEGTFYGVALVSAGPSAVDDNVIGNMTCEGFPPALQGGFCGPDIFVSLQYSGVLAFAAAQGTTIEHNLIFDTDSGIYLLFSTNCCQVRFNTILSSVQYAFEVQDTVAFLAQNTIIGASYEVGVGADVLNSSATLVDSLATGISIGPAFTEAALGLTATATIGDPD